MDEDQQWLLSCLNASLDPNHQVRTFAETSLQQASLQPGLIFAFFIYRNVDFVIFILDEMLLMFYAGVLNWSLRN